MSDCRDVTFVVAGQRLSAKLHLPEDRRGRLPCVVMAHGTTGTMDFALPAYAARFVEAGLAVLTFDYRHFGASDGQPRQLIRVPAQIEDLHAAVSFARSITAVDPTRIALWGTSLGAGHALTVASADPAISAVAAQLPFLGVDPRNDSPRSASVTMKLFARAIRDSIGGWLNRPPVMMKMLGLPGDVAVFSGDEDFEAMQTLAASAPTWRNELAARSLFSLMTYRPIKSARHVTAPVLFLVAEEDTAASTRLAERAAHLAPAGELQHYPGNHFAAYGGSVFERMVSAETTFFTSRLAERPVTRLDRRP